MGTWWVCAVGAATVLLGCNAIFGVDELRFEPSTSASGGSGGTTASSTSGQGAGDGTGGASSSSSTGVGGQGGSGPALVDTGLVARYYIDEASGGQMPNALVDAAMLPLPLPIQYTSALAYTEVDGHRGLAATAASTTGPQAPISATKFHGQLNGALELTIEAVLEFPTIVASSARVLYIGPGGVDGNLSFQLETGVGAMQLNFNNPATGVDSATSVASVAGLGRVVLHTVVNTAEPAAVDRVRFYIDGTSVPAAMGSSNAPPTQGELLALAASDQLMLMNRPTGDRPLVGTLYYLAVYATAFDAAAVATNASLLDQDDDG